MYIPRYHRFEDAAAMHALIDTHALGAWVVASNDGLIANHIPFVLDRTRGPHGTLIGHVSRANGVWRALATSAQSVVMFRGPDGYITPGWYPSKAEHGRVVPTWNYVAVHAHGTARAVDDRDWLRGMLARLTDAHESDRPQPWRLDDAPDGYIDGMLRAIVGIAIPIDRLEGRLKVSQDEAPEDRAGTVRGLRAAEDDQAHALADLVQQAIDAEPLFGRRDQP